MRFRDLMVAVFVLTASAGCALHGSFSMNMLQREQRQQDHAGQEARDIAALLAFSCNVGNTALAIEAADRVGKDEATARATQAWISGHSQCSPRPQPPAPAASPSPLP